MLCEGGCQCFLMTPATDIELLGGKAAVSNPGGVGLDDAEDVTDGVGRETKTGASPAHRAADRDTERSEEEMNEEAGGGEEAIS